MRPALFHIGTNVIWTITTYDPDKPGVEKDADSDPTVTIRKNGSAVGDSVTVTKRASSTGIYDCSYNPAGEVEGDTFTIEESVTITGSTSPSATYRYRWAIETIALERGTDSVTPFPAAAPADWIGASSIAANALNNKGNWLTTLGANAPAGWIDNAAVADGFLSATKIASNALAAAKFAADAVTLLQSGLATATALATAQTSLTTLEGRLTLARAGYLDNLNVGGAVASQADINAINQSASRRIILQSQGQWERPDSGSSSYFIEVRTYSADGDPVNADADPTITITGAVTGSLAANLGGISNPSTGVYRWTYSQPSTANVEAIRVETSATISGSAFLMSMMTQSVDFVSATWTTSDANKLTAVYNKLPSRAYLAGTTSSSGAPLPSDIGLALANLDAQFDEMLADLATREANIRGADNDTLKTLSDQLDGVGGGGGGDATAANQTTIINHLTDIKGAGWSSTTDTLEKIRDAITAALDSVIASVGVTPGAISGWPETMAIGDSYTNDCSRSIHLLVRDASNVPITSIGSHAFTDADFTATAILSQGAQRGRVIGSATWVVGPEGYLNVQIPSKESRRAAEGTATVQVLLRWTVSGDQYTLPATTTRWIAQL